MCQVRRWWSPIQFVKLFQPSLVRGDVLLAPDSSEFTQTPPRQDAKNDVAEAFVASLQGAQSSVGLFGKLHKLGHCIHTIHTPNLSLTMTRGKRIVSRPGLIP